MKENISMLVTFKNCAKLLPETPWILLCADEVHGLDGLLKQKSARKYRATLNQKIWMNWFLCVILPCSTDISASAEVFLTGQTPLIDGQSQNRSASRPERPILNLGHLCGSSGAFISVDILASTSPLRARFRVYTWKFVFDTMHEKLDWFLEN